jgi:signal transduction histidine kinase
MDEHPSAPTPSGERAAEALRLSEERFRTALKTAPIAVFNQDLALATTWIYDPSSIWPGDAAEAASSDAALLRALKRQVIDTGSGARQEVRLRNGDTDSFYDVTIEPLRDATGAIAGITCAAVDITRHHLLEEKLRTQTRELAEADRRKDEFLAMLGHELRNPLAPIANGLHVLKLTDLAPAAHARTLSLMQRQVNHMVRLLDDLLDVSRITRGKIQLRQEPLELADVLSGAVEASTPLIEQRRHRLELHLPSESLRVFADPDRLTQVFANLLHNAAKYTDDGGRITVTATRRGREVIVEVRDTGIGIPTDLMPGIFDVFRQGDTSLDRARGGLGLGLTVVRRLVEMHGGGVSAFSAGPGKGSELVVRLPLLPSDLVLTAPLRTVTPALAGGHRILVVDDNVDAARSLGMALTALGHEVHCVHSGQRALEVVASFHPEVVLLDIGLPGMDGYETARRLRAEPASEQLLLVAVTGYRGAKEGPEARGAGFDHHLLKPVDVERLQSLFAAAFVPPTPLITRAARG